MAIERIHMTTVDDIKSLLESLNYFNDVQIDSNYVKCFIDGIDGEIMAINMGSVLCYLNGKGHSSTYEQFGMNSGVTIGWAYKTKNGVIFFSRPAPENDSSYYSFLIGKTNDDKIAFCVQNGTSPSITTYRSGAVGEHYIGHTGYSLKSNSNNGLYGYVEQSSQIIHIPLITFPTNGESFIENALGLVVAPFRSAGIVTIDGVQYATNGSLALNDE